MPLADFAGSRNWGYDGVLWYAPDSAYGRPEDLKALIDAAHLRGLMVILDVVYNHFGPEGNYLGRYAPAFFTEAHTPWGSAIDYRVKEVRAFAIENALSWLRDYRFDGLRLDAVNSIVEPGGLSLLHDLSAAAGKLAAETGRHIHLVLENGDNRASILDAAQDPPQGKYRAQWNDDYHHAWRVLMTGEKQGYYGDYQRSPIVGYRARAVVRLRLSGRAVGVSRRQARRAERPSGADRLHQLPAEPRPDRQSRARRPARKQCRRAGDRGGARRAAAGAVDSHAVHGRGMGLEGALPVLLRFRAATSPTPSARAAAANMPGPMRNMATRSPMRSTPSTSRSAVLDWNERDAPAAQKRLTLVRELLEDPPARDRPAARGRSLRRGARERQPAC